jgi:hypothetical protein
LTTAELEGDPLSCTFDCFGGNSFSSVNYEKKRQYACKSCNSYKLTIGMLLNSLRPHDTWLNQIRKASATGETKFWGGKIVAEHDGQQ